MADLQVSLAFLLENEAEIARALEQAGGKVGQDFGARLSEGAQKAFDGLVAQAEQAAKKAGLAFNRTELRFETVRGEVVPPRVLDQLAKVDKGFADARQAVERFNSAVSTTSRESTTGLNLLEAAVQGVAFSLANTLTNAAGAALGSVKGLVGGFLELDGELRLAAAAAGEQGGYERLAGIVNKVGIEAAGTTKQVAELSTSLIRAGFSVAEVERALPGVVRGAEATGTGFESFGNIVGNTLRGFGLDVSETARVVDVLTNTANSSNASIEGLGYTFEYTAPIAKALGVSLEDVAAAAGLMANAGIQGSVAGTGLRTGLQKLQQAAGGASPEVLGLARGQERLQKAMAQLGATVSDSSGKLLPLEQVFLRLKAGLQQLNQADQVQLANVIFGDEAGSKFLAITNQSNAAISKMFGDLRNSAGATDTARTAMQGMGMDLKRLEGTVDSLKNQLGGLIAAGLKPMLDAANAVADLVSGLPAPVRNSAGALIALAGAATAASVGMAAINMAVKQLGGLSELRTAVKDAGRIITGTFGASLVIVLGLVAAVGALTGSFKGANQETRNLVQTAAALGAMVGTMKLIGFATAASTGAMTAFGTATKGAAVSVGMLQGVTKGGLIGLLIGLAAGAATYVAIGKAMEGAADKSEVLSEKQRSLKDEISRVQDRIARQKALNLDTSMSEEKLNKLQVELQKLERPLELKLDIKKAEAAVKELEEALKKAKGKPEELDAGVNLNSAKKYKQFLETMDSGGAMTAFSDPVRRGAQEMRDLQKRIDKLLETKRTLPLEAKTDREQIDREIEKNQQYLDTKQAVIKLRIEENEIRNAMQLRESLLAAPDMIASKNRPIVQEKIEALFLRLQENLAAQRRSEESLNKLAENRVDSAKQALDNQLAQLNAAKGQVELQQQALGLGQQQEAMDTKRLQLVKGASDALLNLANAQASYAQSGFELERSRNTYALSNAERELQLLRERGAGADRIAQAEREVADRKAEADRIDLQAMRANIDATTQRLALERQILGIKQAIQEREAQAAEAQARSDVLSQEMRLRELQIKAVDPSTTAEQKTLLQQQIDLQGQAISLAIAKAAALQGEREQRGLLYGLERASLDAQQQATANQLRAGAAAKGWEQNLSGALGQLDQVAFGYERVESVTKRLTGTITAGGQTVNLYEEVRQLPGATNAAESAAKNLASAYADAQAQAGKLLATVEAIGRVPTARWAGGPVAPGASYQVNELGTESFLSAGGSLSLITAPAYGTWSPPVRGTVLPASVTSRLQQAGALPGGSRGSQGAPGPAGAPGAPGRIEGVIGSPALALHRLQGSIDRLQQTMAAHDPRLEVHLPGNAGLLSTLQGLR